MADLHNPLHVGALHRPRVLRRFHSPEEWERVRPIITRLYFVENKPLERVRHFMEREYDFYATARTYKSRIEKWDLHKNFRDFEMRAVLRIGTQHLSQGARTAFMIRGREVTLEDARRFFQKKGTGVETILLSDPGPKERELIQRFILPDEPASFDPTSSSLDSEDPQNGDSESDVSDATSDSSSTGSSVSDAMEPSIEDPSEVDHLAMIEIPLDPFGPFIKSPEDLLCTENMLFQVEGYLEFCDYRWNDDVRPPEAVGEFYDLLFETGVQMKKQANRRALKLYKKAATVVEEIIPDHSLRLLSFLFQLTCELASRGQHHVMVKMLEFISITAGRTFTKQHPLVAIAESLSRDPKWMLERAELGLSRAVDLHLDALGDQAPKTLDVMRRFVLALIYCQKFAQATRMAQWLLEATEQYDGWDSKKACEVLILLADCHHHNHEFDLAEQYLKECSVRTSLLPENRQELRYFCLLGLFKLAEIQHHLEKAKTLLAGAIRYGKEAFGDEDHSIIQNRNTLSQVEDRIAAEHMGERRPSVPTIDVHPMAATLMRIRLG